MTIYTFLYNPSCCESALATMSIHKTKLGAYRAMKSHKVGIFNEWMEQAHDYHRERFKYDFDQWWGIGEIELQD